MTKTRGAGVCNGVQVADRRAQKGQLSSPHHSTHFCPKEGQAHALAEASGAGRGEERQGRRGDGVEGGGLQASAAGLSRC